LRRASQARKETRKSLSGREEKKEEAVLVPHSSAPSRPTLSFPEVSTSPVDDDEMMNAPSTKSTRNHFQARPLVSRVVPIDAFHC